MENERQRACIPCGHYCMCDSCMIEGKYLENGNGKECPICKAKCADPHSPPASPTRRPPLHSPPTPLTFGRITKMEKMITHAYCPHIHAHAHNMHIPMAGSRRWRRSSCAEGGAHAWPRTIRLTNSVLIAGSRRPSVALRPVSSSSQRTTQ